MRRSAKAAQSAHTDSCARFCFLAAFRAGGRIGWFCQSQIPTNRSPIDPQFPGNASLGPWEKQFLAAEADGLAVTYENLIDSYLSETHRDHPGNGRPISALACDIARGSQQIRSLLTERVKSSLELIANLLPQDDSAARSKAILTVSSLLGAVELARAVSDQTLSDEILESAREVLKQFVRRNTQPNDGGGASVKKT